ncbi:MAG TPA: amidohydrolase family protein [Candidatus Binatia bacterium]|nr:amidohydrolase family protein [Candidatus Binatia bacterium]
MATERIISADSHVNPPKDLWTKAAPAALRDRAPHVESTPQGDFWIVDAKISGAIGLDASAGRKPEEFKPHGLTYKDMRPGSYDPKARLEDMDTDGVDAEVLYFGGPVTQLATDNTLRMFVVRTYNDWMAELSTAAPGRLIGLAHIPLLDLDEAVAELRRVAKLGIRGFHVDPFPDERGAKPLWDPAYEPFWSAVEETGLPMSFHIVGPRNQNVAATFMNPTPGVKETFIAIAPISICEVVSTLVFTGILERHPKLRFVLVECGIGWLPYFIERMDQTFEKHRFWTKSIIGEKPSTYWFRQGHATFIRDLAGVAERHRAGLRNIMWSTDYPHSDSTWPRSREALAEHFQDVPAAERALIAGGNCAALYGLA